MVGELGPHLERLREGLPADEDSRAHARARLVGGDGLEVAERGETCRIEPHAELLLHLAHRRLERRLARLELAAHLHVGAGAALAHREQLGPVLALAQEGDRGDLEDRPGAVRGRSVAPLGRGEGGEASQQARALAEAHRAHPRRLPALEVPALVTGQPPAPPQQRQRRLAALAQVPGQSQREHHRGGALQHDRVGQQPQLPQRRDELRGEDPLGDQQLGVLGAQCRGAGASGERDRVDGHLGDPVMGEGDECFERGPRVPGGRIVPVHNPEAVGEGGIVVVAVELVQRHRGQTRAVGHHALAAPRGAGDDDDAARGTGERGRAGHGGRFYGRSSAAGPPTRCRQARGRRGAAVRRR